MGHSGLKMGHSGQNSAINLSLTNIYCLSFFFVFFRTKYIYRVLNKYYSVFSVFLCVFTSSAERAEGIRGRGSNYAPSGLSSRACV